MIESMTFQIFTFWISFLYVSIFIHFPSLRYIWNKKKAWSFHVFTFDSELIAWWFSYVNFEITKWILVKIIIKRIKWFGEYSVYMPIVYTLYIPNHFVHKCYCWIVIYFGSHTISKYILYVIRIIILISACNASRLCQQIKILPSILTEFKFMRRWVENDHERRV